MEGLPAGYPCMVRRIIRPFRFFVTRVRFPLWLPIPAAIQHKLQPPSDAVLEDQHMRLLSAIENFHTFDGELPPHPVLGKLTREEWTGFHIQHSRHHFAFVKVAD